MGIRWNAQLDKFYFCDPLITPNYIELYQAIPSARRETYRFANKQIKPGEIIFVKNRLVIIAQKVYYPEEYRCLMEKHPLPSSSSLLLLNPILDSDGILRLNGRLEKSRSPSYLELCPIILPYSSRFTPLLFDYIHLI